MSEEQVTYEEANPFSTSVDNIADMEPSDMADKTWHTAMEDYGAEKVDENTVKWKFEKTESNVAQTDPHADYGETVVEVTMERLENDDDVVVTSSEFQFTAEVLKEGVTVTGTTTGPLEALVKVLETAERYDFHHYFKTDVPEHIKNEIFKDEVQSREWDFFGTDEDDE